MRTKQHSNRGQSDRAGFTLVELLVVITIIGAIAALTIPAIGRVMRSVRKSSMKAELTNIETGLNDYRTKYGDYPPDFVDWSIVRRHYLKIFPDIATSELNLLYRLCDVEPDNSNNQMASNPQANAYNPAAMDRAEALVWSLGGFSSDSQYPFTGSGGPLARLPNTGALAIDNPAAYEYNPTRVNPQVEFDASRLSVRTPPNAGATRTFTNRFASNDADFGGNQNDLFPAYSLREGQHPVVYFDSRTYAYNAGNQANPNFNGYLTPSTDSDTGFDGVRPVFSTTPGNDGSEVSPTSEYGSYAAALTGWQFENAQTFQVIAPGLDGLFGELIDVDATNDPSPDEPLYFHMSGGMVQPEITAEFPLELLSQSVSSAVSRFDLTGIPALRDSPNAFRDNMANFIGGTFEDELP